MIHNKYFKIIGISTGLKHKSNLQYLIRRLNAFPSQRKSIKVGSELLALKNVDT